MIKTQQKISGKQVLIKDNLNRLEFVYDIEDPEVLDFLERHGVRNENGELILSYPLTVAIYRKATMVIDTIYDSISKKYKEVNIPELDIKIAPRPEIDTEHLDSCTNLQLEEFLLRFGSYRAYLETYLAGIESRQSILEKCFEEGLNRALYELNKKYAVIDGRKPTKEALQGEALATNPTLKKVKQDLIENDGLFLKVRGLRDSYKVLYDAVSRVVALRLGTKEQV